LTAAAATVAPGSTLSINWKIIAADGEGTVTMNVDTSGGLTFQGGSAVSIAQSGAAPSALQQYTLTFAIPSSLTCAATNGLCNAQFTAQGWVSCSLFQFSTTATPTNTTTPPTGSCVNASGLSYCTQVNGHSVKLLPGQTLVNLDDGAKDTAQADLNNPNVFLAPTTPGCVSAYQSFVCANTFLQCTNNNSALTTNACFTVANQSSVLCGLKDTHRDYLSLSYYTNAGSDSCGPCLGRSFTSSTDSQVNNNSTGNSSPATVSFTHPLVSLVFFVLVLVLF